MSRLYFKESEVRDVTIYKIMLPSRRWTQTFDRAIKAATCSSVMLMERSVKLIKRSKHFEDRGQLIERCP